MMTLACVFASHAICAGPVVFLFRTLKRWIIRYLVYKHLVPLMLMTPFPKTLLDIMVYNMEKTKRPS